MCDLFARRRNVQQRFRWNAADIQTDTTEGAVAFDQNGLQTKIGRTERGGVAAGAGPEHQYLAVDVGGVRSVVIVTH